MPAKIKITEATEFEIHHTARPLLPCVMAPARVHKGIFLLSGSRIFLPPQPLMPPTTLDLSNIQNTYGALLLGSLMACTYVTSSRIAWLNAENWFCMLIRFSGTLAFQVEFPTRSAPCTWQDRLTVWTGLVFVQAIVYYMLYPKDHISVKITVCNTLRHVAYSFAYGLTYPWFNRSLLFGPWYSTHEDS